MTDVTRILQQMSAGHSSAAENLLSVVYNRLRAVAAARLKQERPGQTLQATALVHEAWLRLVSGEVQQDWESRRHFFAAAAEAMRRILVDRARHKATGKAGGGRMRLALSAVEAVSTEPPLDVLELNEALEKLESRQPRKAALVRLRFFAGLSIRESADVLGVAPSTAELDWAYARSWLRVEMDQSSADRSNRGHFEEL